ncbi:hypothetical protein FACS189445_4980 [Spirochaetia bacterium]|nr:hypothetical protein FACS189445_4980 [Spirochaetia bacterium]
MIDSTQLKILLGEIDTSFQNETDTNRILLWAKIATLEVSGWTEECIDDLLNAYLDSINPLCKNELLKKIRSIYSFHYSNDFRNICVQILGNIMFERIQKKIPLECQQLESALNGLKTNRDKYAHTHIINKSPLDSPQRSLEYLNKIEIGLRRFMAELRKMRLKR